MVPRSSRHGRGGLVDWAFTIGMICFLVWGVLCVADATYERVIGIRMVLSLILERAVQRRRTRRPKKLGPSRMAPRVPTWQRRTAFAFLAAGVAFLFAVFLMGHWLSAAIVALTTCSGWVTLVADSRRDQQAGLQ